MNTLHQILTYPLLLLMPVQSLIFVRGPATRDSMWRSYASSWARTFRLATTAIAFLLRPHIGGGKADRRASVLFLVWAVLSVPGFFIVRHALVLMK